MEVDDIQNQVCKFPRISTSNKIGQKMDDEDESEAKRMGVSRNDYGRLCGWPSSRIVRVSRASGGKDRHSKVWTSKGLRDRRVRLSVTTAIQFYDLQDRLGYDQPSKAVDWLLRAAETSISELPSLNHSFLDTPLSDEIGSGETGIESTELEMEVDPSYNQQQQNVSLSKSACSSTSETSKGSGGILSVSRSENRIKARERARGRAAEKVKNENEQSLFAGHQQNVSTSSSFTELLTGNLSSTNSPKVSSQWHSTPMDHFLTGYSGQIHMGNSLAPFSITTGDHNHNQELHQFSFVPDNNLVPVATAAGGNDNYNLNFSVSSGLAAGYNRGTLQSNSPSMRFAPIDGSNVPFFISPKGENHQHHHHHQQQHHHQQHHHQFAAGSDLQLFYGDANWNSDQKGKGKN